VKRYRKLLALNFPTSLAASLSEGATLGIIFLAVSLISAPENSDWSKISILGSLAQVPWLQDWLTGALSTRAGRDSIFVLLLATAALVAPIMGYFKLSPVLGFLAAGILLGPTGLGVVADVASTTKLAELGVVFFLFEMGERLALALLPHGLFLVVVFFHPSHTAYSCLFLLPDRDGQALFSESHRLGMTFL